VNALEEFRQLRIEFISLHEGVDTSTPNGRLVFGIFASIAVFERELIRDRVKSGIAAARAKGTRLGRPRRIVDSSKVALLRADGLSWASIASQMGIGEGTARRVFEARAKTCQNSRRGILESGLAPRSPLSHGTRCDGFRSHDPKTS
jgi:DNA invertase Pin-like site-specific DNA recombinase